MNTRLDEAKFSASPMVTSFARKRPAVILLACIVAGVLIGQAQFINWWIWFSLAAVSLVSAILLLSYNRQTGAVALTLLAIVFIFSGRINYHSFGKPDRHISNLAGDDLRYTIYARVVDWPDIRDKSCRLTIEIDSTENQGIVIPRIGGALIHISTPAREFQYGDRLILSGKFAKPPALLNPNGFDYQRYLRWKNIFAIVYLPHHFGINRNPESAYTFSGLVDNARDGILDVFQQTMEPEQAALSSGFLLGEVSDISENVYEYFRDSGTLHMLAVSGSNVAIALLAVRIFLIPFPLTRRARYALLILGAIVFSYLSHNEPSVIRAATMASVYLIGRGLERRVDYHNIIAVAGVLILSFSPGQLFDAGFLLSFTVSWFLILSAPLFVSLTQKLKRSFWRKYLIMSVGIAVVAQLASAPLILYFFGKAPVWGAAANLVIGPLVGVCVAMSLVTILAYAILPMLGMFIGALLNQVLRLVLTALEFFGSEVSAQVNVHGLSEYTMILSLVALATLIVSVQHKRVRQFALVAVIVAPTFIALSELKADIFERRAIWFYATRAGVFSVIEGAAPVVILSDLRGDPESILNYVILPQLNSLQNSDTLNVVSLSSDYVTLATALKLYDSRSGVRLILSEKSRNMWSDMSLIRELNGVEDMPEPS
ncbi:MAG: ComEC family competence protein, partial [candidate division Zixibacteria bacterium]|nr:ComEC family competence protein [candidate division Zixibacteria bacterium]